MQACLDGRPPRRPAQVYGSSVTPQVKRECLTTLSKMLHFNSADTLAGAPPCACYLLRPLLPSVVPAVLAAVGLLSLPPLLLLD